MKRKKKKGFQVDSKWVNSGAACQYSEGPGGVGLGVWGKVAMESRVLFETGSTGNAYLPSTWS